MGRISDVQNAFLKRIDTLSSAELTNTNIMDENVSYEPTLGTTWIRPILLPAESNLETLDNIQGNPGLYQIDIFCEVEKGTNTLITLMDDIYDHFKGVDLTENNTQIFVTSISRTPARKEAEWYMGSIVINYLSFAT